MNHPAISAPPPESKKPWYLLYTKPKLEALAQMHLARQDYCTYLPYCSTKKRLKGRYQCVQEVMFPRYLFIALDEGVDDWGPIRSTRGVSALVRFGQQLARLPDELIMRLQARELATVEGEPDAPLFHKGNKVRVIHGPFSGYDAIFQAKTGAARAEVLLQLLHREARVKVPMDELIKVDEGA